MKWLLRFAKKHKIWTGLILSVILAVAIGNHYKDSQGWRVMAFSHDHFGEEITREIEGKYFAVLDPINRLKFRIFGGTTDPFGTKNAVYPPTPTPQLAVLAKDPVSDAETAKKEVEVLPTIAPPQTALAEWELPLTVPQHPEMDANEGRWRFDELPNIDGEPNIVAKTFILPDSSRDSSVGIALFDHRLIRLHHASGGNYGGLSSIPSEHRRFLIFAWEGGFQLKHAPWGMRSSGVNKELLTGYASVAMSDEDRTFNIGMYGREIFWTNDTVAVRQNGAALLVDDCKVNPNTGRQNDWGIVDEKNLAKFITTRSGIGITANGDLMYAAGPNLSAATLARAMQAAGACRAMQLDINTPWVLASKLYPQNLGATVNSYQFIDKMSDDPADRFFKGNKGNDFFYVTVDLKKSK